MIEYGHYIGGKRVAGKSGKTADVFQPMDGTVRAKVALASKAEVRAAVENRAEGAAGLGRDQPAAPRPRADEVPRTRRPRQRQARRMPRARARQDHSPTPRATSSAASKWSSSPSARRT